MKEKEILSKLAIENKILLPYLASLMGLTYDADEHSYFNKDNNRLEWDECETLDVDPSIKMQYQDEEIWVDSILLFGDGTIEFHDQEEEDAYNWAEFSVPSLKKICQYLKDKYDSIAVERK